MLVVHYSDMQPLHIKHALSAERVLGLEKYGELLDGNVRVDVLKAGPGSQSVLRKPTTK